MHAWPHLAPRAAMWKKHTAAGGPRLAAPVPLPLLLPAHPPPTTMACPQRCTGGHRPPHHQSQCRQSDTALGVLRNYCIAGAVGFIGHRVSANPGKLASHTHHTPQGWHARIAHRLELVSEEDEGHLCLLGNRQQVVPLRHQRRRRAQRGRRRRLLSTQQSHVQAAAPPALATPHHHRRHPGAGLPAAATTQWVGAGFAAALCESGSTQQARSELTFTLPLHPCSATTPPRQSCRCQKTRAASALTPAPGRPPAPAHPQPPPTGSSTPPPLAGTSRWVCDVRHLAALQMPHPKWAPG